jgi:ABC-2 type transport system ATP-binding protein
VAAVEVNTLSKHYSGVVAVADISFTAAAGEVTAVLGPNGAGKTTTIEICAGLRTADAGSVSILDLDPRSPQLRARVGVMPQGGSTASGIYPSARVGEVLRLHAAFHTDPLPTEDLLRHLGLDSVERTPWRRLSGGEQQRLSLALALVGRPDVVFLDEPTAGLDVQGRHATWQLITELRAAGAAVVLTTHLLDEAEHLADEVVIVNRGLVVASGSPDALTKAADGHKELRFDATPALPLESLIGELSPDTTASEPEPGRYVVSGAITPDTVATVTAWCAKQGVMADRLTTGSRTLEAVFLALTTPDPQA